MKSLKTHRQLRNFIVAFVTLALSVECWSAEITGWGTVIDPDGDCDVKESDGSVIVKLPAGKHDLWYGSKETINFNSPRVLQQIDGNFVATVRVTAYWDRGIADGGGYNGAGLVVWESEEQYLRLERNRFDFGRGTYTYTSPLYDQNSRRVFYSSTRDEFFKGNTTWLRIIRNGSNFATNISHDGKKWITTGVVNTEFPNAVRVGIHAINLTESSFAVRFDKFSIERIK